MPSKLQFLHPYQLFLLLVFMMCGSEAKVQSVNPEFLHSIASKADYDLLKGKPLTEKYGMVESVNNVLDLRDDQLYFVSSEKWR